jgi:hypothetical protein
VNGALLRLALAALPLLVACSETGGADPPRGVDASACTLTGYGACADGPPQCPIPDVALCPLGTARDYLCGRAAVAPPRAFRCEGTIVLSRTTGGRSEAYAFLVDGGALFASREADSCGSDCYGPAGYDFPVLVPSRCAAVDPCDAGGTGD